MFQTRLRLMVFGLVLGPLVLSPIASFSQEDAAELGESYARSFRELDGQFATHISSGEKLIQERQETLKRLAETEATFAKLASAKLVATMESMQAELMETSLRDEVNSTIQSYPVGAKPTGIDPRSHPRSQIDAHASLMSRELRSRLNPVSKKMAELQVMQDLFQHEIKTINAAGQMTMQRHLDQMKELHRITFDMQKWGQDSRVAFGKYWQLCDSYATKSEIELEAALAQLETSSKQNLGAVYARAVTLTRLKKFDEALELMEPLMIVPEISGLALGLQAEILLRNGKTRESAAALKKTNSSTKNPAVRIQRAMVYSIAGQFKKAEQEWQGVRQAEGLETVARRGLAWVYGSANSDCRHPKRALENASIAVQLDSTDWSSVLALSLAHSLNGDKDKAIQFANEAALLTVGDNHSFCETIAQQIEADEPVSWRF